MHAGSLDSLLLLEHLPVWFNVITGSIKCFTVVGIFFDVRNCCKAVVSLRSLLPFHRSDIALHHSPCSRQSEYDGIQSSERYIR